MVLARPSLHLATIVVLAALVFLSGVATQPLDGDPAMYATIAKTIAHTGEWLHLTFNGEPYLNKPPLHFWLNALVFRALGPCSLTACLLPGLLGAGQTSAVGVRAQCPERRPSCQTREAPADTTGPPVPAQPARRDR